MYWESFLHTVKLYTLDRRYISMESKDSVSYTFVCVYVYRWGVWGVYSYMCEFPCVSMYTNKGQMKTLDVFLYQTALFPWDKVSNNPGVRLIGIKCQQFYCVCPSRTRVQAYVDIRRNPCPFTWVLRIWTQAFMSSKYCYPVSLVPQVNSVFSYKNRLRFSFLVFVIT